MILASIYFMFVTSHKELAPTEDQSILFFQATAPQTATIDYDMAYVQQIEDAFETFPEFKESFFLIGMGGSPANSFGGFKMPFPSQRERSQMQIQPLLQHKLSKIAGLQISVFPRPSIPGAEGGLPVQFVISSDAGLRPPRPDLPTR